MDAGFNELMAWTPPPRSQARGKKKNKRHGRKHQTQPKPATTEDNSIAQEEQVAIAPPTQPPDATEGACDSQESQQQSTTVSPTSRTGVIRGLTPLEAGAARAIPRTVTAETSAFEEHHPQPKQHVRTATECSNYVYSQTDVQETDASHAYHEDTELPGKARQRHLLPAAGGPTPTSTPWTAQLVPPDADETQLRGLHPQVDVFEETASPADEHTGTKDCPQNSGIGEQTEADFFHRQEEVDWGRDSHDETEGSQEEAGESEQPAGAWGSQRPAEPSGPPPTQRPSNQPRRRAPLTEAARVARNRQDRAEWRERRRLRRRMGLEVGYLYDNGVQRAPKRSRSERDEPSMPRTRSR